MHRVRQRLSQAEVAVTGAVEFRDRMKVEFERGPTQICKSASRGAIPPASVHLVGEMEAENSQIVGTCGRVGRDQCCSRTSSGAPACVRDCRGWFMPPPGEFFTWLDRQISKRH